MRFFEPFASFRRAYGAAVLSPVSFDATSEYGRSGQSLEPSGSSPWRGEPRCVRASLRSTAPPRPKAWSGGATPSVPPVTEVTVGRPNRVSGRSTDRNRRYPARFAGPVSSPQCGVGPGFAKVPPVLFARGRGGPGGTSAGQPFRVGSSSDRTWSEKLQLRIYGLTTRGGDTRFASGDA
jgi:hypothetical protein